VEGNFGTEKALGDLSGFTAGVTGSGVSKMTGGEGAAESCCALLSMKDATADINCCCSERICSMMACCELKTDLVL
jgi:hypothetical protein